MFFWTIRQRNQVFLAVMWSSALNAKWEKTQVETKMCFHSCSSGALLIFDMWPTPHLTFPPFDAFPELSAIYFGLIRLYITSGCKLTVFWITDLKNSGVPLQFFMLWIKHYVSVHVIKLWLYEEQCGKISTGNHQQFLLQCNGYI